VIDHGKRVAVVVGSLRTSSWNRKVTQELITLAPYSLRPEIVEIRQLPLYNQDFDDSGKPRRGNRKPVAPSKVSGSFQAHTVSVVSYGTGPVGEDTENSYLSR